MENLNFTVSDVCFAYYKKYRPRQVFEKKNRTNNGLTLVLSGALQLRFSNGEKAVARKNDVIIQRLGDSYRLEALEEGAEYIVISYLAVPSENVFRLLPSSRVYTPTHHNRYVYAFESAVRVYSSLGVCSATLLRALVQEILCHLIRESYSKTLFSDNLSLKVKLYIEDNFSKQITSERLAMIAKCSPSHLRATFKQAYGEPPIKYLNKIRVEHAKKMLSSGVFTINEIATSCGFQNIYYFSRVFKQITGVSPGKY